MAEREKDAMTDYRYWIRYEDLQMIPLLPERVAIDELKEFGLVNVRHTKKPGTAPSLKSGFYRLIGHDGRLYVVKLCDRPPNGETAAVWLYRPIIRIKAQGRIPNA
jgi:hypothetical protein